MALIEHLPFYYKESSIVKDLFKPIDLENERLIATVETTKNEFVVNTAVYTLSKYEEEYGLPINPNVSIEERRSRIIARMRSTGTTTKELVKTIAMSWSNGEVDVIEYSSQYKIEIQFVGTIGIPANIDYLKQSIYEIIPVHLEVEYTFKYNTVQVLRETGLTVKELSDKNLTVVQLIETKLN